MIFLVKELAKAGGYMDRYNYEPKVFTRLAGKHETRKRKPSGQLFPSSCGDWSAFVPPRDARGEARVATAEADGELGVCVCDK